MKIWCAYVKEIYVVKNDESGRRLLSTCNYLKWLHRKYHSKEKISRAVSASVIAKDILAIHGLFKNLKKILSALVTNFTLNYTYWTDTKFN